MIYNMFSDDKRGQGLSINAIILIVLGVIVLVVLIAGFTIGWSNIKDFIAPGNNVDKVATACETACSLGDQFDYCSTPRNLKSPSGNLKDVTCNYLSQKKTEYGVDVCGTICGSTIIIVENKVTADAECVKAENAGKSVQYLEEDKLITLKCPQKVTP